jgi:hypothetical protein
MKKLIYFIFISLFMLVSCNDDFLEKQPLDKISEKAVFSNEGLLTAYVNTFYDAIPHPFTEGTLAAITDEGYFRYGGTSTNYIARGEMTPDKVVYISEGGYAHNTRMTYLNIWKRAYTYIRNMNDFLDQIDEATVSENIKKQMKGEVYFFRAWTYANLIWRYAGVPIITKAYSTEDDFYDVKRNNYDDCVNFVLSDINSALAYLPETPTQKGRVFRDVALALKSRVWLYAASPLFNDPNDPNPTGDNLIFKGVYSKAKWDSARVAAKAVIDLPGYDLADNYKDIWYDVNCPELIWAKYFDRSWAKLANLAQVLYSPGYFFGGWLSCTPYEQMVCEYEMKDTGKLPFEDGSGYDPSKPWDGRDPRFYETIIYPGCTFRGLVIDSYKSADPRRFPHGPFYNETVGTGGSGYWLKKWHIEDDVISETDNATRFYPWFRLGEIYLNYAEACLNSGDEATCREYINKIRNRASVMMPPIGDEVTGDELREKLIHERRIELAFEDKRFFDLRRWKLANIYENIPGYGIEVIKQTNGTLVYNIAQKGENGKPDYSKCLTKIVKSFSNQFYLQPIPGNEMTKAQGVLIQNPGY